MQIFIKLWRCIIQQKNLYGSKNTGHRSFFKLLLAAYLTGWWGKWRKMCWCLCLLLVWLTLLLQKLCFHWICNGNIVKVGRNKNVNHSIKTPAPHRLLAEACQNLNHCLQELYRRHPGHTAAQLKNLQVLSVSLRTLALPPAELMEAVWWQCGLQENDSCLFTVYSTWTS